MVKTSPYATLEQLGLPAAVEAERFVLGSIILDQERLADVQSVLDTQDFTLEKHRVIFECMVSMAKRGDAVDQVTLVNDLHAQGKLDSVDGVSYLVSLNDGLPRLPNVDSYLKLVRQKSLLRQTIAACSELMNACLLQGDPPEEILSRGERLLSDINGKVSEDSDFQTPSEIIRAAGGVDAYFRARRVPGLMTKWDSFNRLTRGLQPGNLIVLAARTSKGKSAFAANLAVQVATEGHGVAFFSLEMDRVEVNDRLMALAGECEFSALRGANREVVRHAIANVSALPIHICDVTGRTVPAIQAKVRRLSARSKIDLIIVDYLQLLSPAGRSENRTQEVSAMTRALKLAAQELRIPIVALSQLKRAEGTAPNRKPTLSDLRESGSIEQDSNMVLFLHAEAEYRSFEPGTAAPVTLTIAKQRSGPTDEIPMYFWPDRGLFREAQSD